MDAAAFVAPIFFIVYMGLGLIWSSSIMGEPINILEDHIKMNMPANAEKLKNWEFVDVAVGPLM